MVEHKGNKPNRDRESIYKRALSFRALIKLREEMRRELSTLPPDQIPEGLKRLAKSSNQ